MSMDSSANRVGDRLLTALTQTELGHLLDALIQILPANLLEQGLSQLPADTQQTIQQILTPSAEEAAAVSEAQPVSLAKLAQTWSELWQEWDEITWEASQEEGRYIAQEAHWEPPYFDNYAFAEDLEKVAEKMQPLIKVAFEQEFSPDQGFVTALLEAEAEIAEGIPEWMEITDGIELERHVTTCLLQWEWLVAQDAGQDAFHFVQRIRQLDDEFSLMGLDDDALLDFLSQLPQPDQQAMLAGLTAAKETPRWKQVLSNVYSPWHLFYLDALSQFAPDRYLDNLRLTIPQRWQNGLPVIEDLLADKNYPESLKLIQETLAALLSSQRSNLTWTPETSLLLAAVDRFYAGSENENQKTLLSYFEQTAQGLGQSERVNALKIQQIACDHCFDWQVMLQAFAEIPVSEPTRQALFQSWRDQIIQRVTSRGWRFGSGQSAEPGWLNWLLDSITDPQKGAPWFQQQITQWLTSLPGDRRSLDNAYHQLRLLTKDTVQIQGKQQLNYPYFYEVVIRPAELSTPDEASRQAYLQQFAPADLWEQLMHSWSAHLHHFVPNPVAAHKSDYSQHAKWMAALQEVAPQAYKSLLAQWRIDHQRRRNLWKAMQSLGLG